MEWPLGAGASGGIGAAADGDQRYLFGMCGTVLEMFLPGKAIITFDLNGDTQRALLWVKCFVHQDKLLDQADSLAGKLSVGDTLYFDCHIYDKESKDKCHWYAARASKEKPTESHPAYRAPINVQRVVNQNGYIFEVEQGKGVIVFDYNNIEQRVFFMRSKFYLFGKRPNNKHSLRTMLSENDPLQFDAEQCEPSEENLKCNWFATIVWKGKKPTGTQEEMTADYSGSNTGAARGALTAEDFPSLGTSATSVLPPGVIDKQGYKAFESSGNIREGKGNVLSMFNEECGIALWMVKRNTWETVFFHRKNSFLDSVHLSNYDLRESFSGGTALDICAVPAIPEFPCRWIAQIAVAKC